MLGHSVTDSDDWENTNTLSEFIEISPVASIGKNKYEVAAIAASSAIMHDEKKAEVLFILDRILCILVDGGGEGRQRWTRRSRFNDTIYPN